MSPVAYIQCDLTKTSSIHAFELPFPLRGQIQGPFCFIYSISQTMSVRRAAVCTTVQRISCPKQMVYPKVGRSDVF